MNVIVYLKLLRSVLLVALPGFVDILFPGSALAKGTGSVSSKRNRKKAMQIWACVCMHMYETDCWDEKKNVRHN